MRVLLTRAEADAARTRAALAAMGHGVIVSPLIAYESTGTGIPPGVIDGMLATSAQAFAQDHGLSPEARRLMPLFVVGGRTAEAARDHGFAGPLTLAPQASALVALLADMAWPPRHLVYVAGRDRKPDLETALAAGGWRCTVVTVYEACSAPGLSGEALAAIKRGTVDAVLHFSRRSAGLFLTAATMAEIDVAGLVHFSLSDDVAAPLRGAGCHRVRIADAPNEAALLSMLRATAS